MASIPQAEADEDAIEVIARSTLCAGLAELDRLAGRLPPVEFARRVAALRQAAQAHGYVAVARLAGCLGTALAEDGRAAIVRPYLAAIREALGGCAQDDAVTERLLASIGVRLVG